MMSSSESSFSSVAVTLRESVPQKTPALRNDRVEL